MTLYVIGLANDPRSLGALWGVFFLQIGLKIDEISASGTGGGHFLSKNPGNPEKYKKSLPIAQRVALGHW